MAINPMQRKTRVSFMLGLVIGLLFMLVAAGIGFVQVRKLQEEIDKEKSLEKTYYVLNKDVKAEDELTIDDFDSVKIKSEVHKPENFLGYDLVSSLEDQLLENSDSKERAIAKIDLKASTLVTEDMIEINSLGYLSDTERLVDVTGVILPPDLEVGDTIDVRIILPDGTDYTVLTHKKVQNTNQNIIWLKLEEDEIRFLTSALVESYIYDGMQLYATKYTNPGIQNKALATYVPTEETLSLFLRDASQLNNPSQFDGEGMPTDSSELVNNLNKITQLMGNVYISGGNTRQAIQAATPSSNGDPNQKVEQGINASRNEKEAAREEYIEGLLGAGGY